MFVIRILAASALLVTSIVTSAGTPTLVGSVQLEAPSTGGIASADGKLFVVQLQGSDRRPSGLQVIDTSNVERPRLAGFAPLPKNGDMSLAGDGKFALFSIPTEKETFNQETPHEIIAIDLSESNKPRELWRKKVMARGVALSSEANAFAYSRYSSDKQDKWETVVVLVKGTLSTRVIEEGEYFDANMALSANANFLAYAWDGQIRLWDLRAKSPILYKQESIGFDRYKYHCIPSVLDSGYVVMEDSRSSRFGIYKAAPSVPRISTLSHQTADYCNSISRNAVDPVLMFSDSNGQLQQFDVRNVSSPQIGSVWQLPNGIFAFAAARNILFATNGNNNPELQLYRLDTDHPVEIDWQALSEIHRTILKAYNEDIAAKKPAPSSTAVNGFQEAGIIQALDAQVNSISAQRAAAILNDYGFLASQSGAPQRLVLLALKRAIALDPSRAIAHLNLADFLQDMALKQSANAATKERLLKESKEQYQTYQELGGKRASRPNSSPKDDQVFPGGADICSIIAANANAGRLGAYVSDNGSNIPMGTRSIDMVFTTEGTAHIPTYYAFDSVGDFPLKAGEIPAAPPGSNDDWGGDHLGLLKYKNEYHILDYKDFHHPTSSISLVDGKTCKFKVRTKETIGPDATEPELCAMLQNGTGPASLKFSYASPMSPDNVLKRWGESKIVGTRLLDIANDGHSLNIAELEMTSGAGAGCDELFFETVNRDVTKFTSGIQRDLLMQLQGANPSNRYPILPCANKPRFFSHKSRIYFETKPVAWPPKDEWNQYHRVTTIDSGRVHDVCEFKFDAAVYSTKN